MLTWPTSVSKLRFIVFTSGLLSWRCCSKCQGEIGATNIAAITTADRSIAIKPIATTIKGSLCQGRDLVGAKGGKYVTTCVPHL